MASFVQKLYHSFVNTLFYVWTAIQALFSMRSPKPFPFRETSIVVPYPLALDLESGSAVMEGTKRVSGAAVARMLLMASQNAVQKTIAVDAELQESLRSSPAFSSPPRPQGAQRVGHGISPDVDLSASAKRMLLASWANKSMSTSHDERPLPPIPPPIENDITEDTTGIREVTLDPFLDENPASPFLFTDYDKHRLENPLLIPFKLPFCTSTPPRSRRDGKGHRRAALAPITNIAHLNIPASFESLPSPTATEPFVETPLKDGNGHKGAVLATVTDVRHLTILASSTRSLFSPAAAEPLVETPSARKLHSPSFEGQPAFEDVDLSSPTPPSPGKCASGVSNSSPAIHFSAVTPLRIVKRNVSNPGGAQTPPTSKASVGALTPVQRETPDSSGTRSSRLSDISHVVTAAVRNAFIRTRQEDEDDEGMGARELISRASVWTCDLSQLDLGLDAEDGETDSRYSEEATIDASCSEYPPPPYAFSDSNPVLNSETDRSMLQPASGVPAGVSGEVSGLEGNTPLDSVDSCLDEILASFEQLITTMPKFQASLARSQGPTLSTAGVAEKVADANPVLNTVRRVLNDARGRRAAHQSSTLQLDNY
ncbi:hypothetical protein LshimejAT787_1801660 [Lyophyllum shimeji]|uniref:Uncharacterized protein n=1 Tax=Lyophyllum shimeji TaxID=47721 RepID=A0A9P3UR94_LYOSH|nr:hypothetical protein LshimejAT787_1801660 [Lyophyllum shimeji]